MVQYDMFRALSAITRAVDGTAEGIWDKVSHGREEVIAEAKSRLDEAAELIARNLSEDLIPYVGDEEVAAVAAALAFSALEGWEAAIDISLYAVEFAATDRCIAELSRRRRA
jgi:hypothetical protein